MRRQFGKDNNQLFDKNLPLPPELSWENMEDGILAKMAAKRPFYKRPVFRWSGLILLLGMITWLALGNDQTAQQGEEYITEEKIQPSTEEVKRALPANSTETLSEQVTFVEVESPLPKEITVSPVAPEKAESKAAMITPAPGPINLVPQPAILIAKGTEEKAPNVTAQGGSEPLSGQAKATQLVNLQLNNAEQRQTPRMRKLTEKPGFTASAANTVSQHIPTYALPTTLATSLAQPTPPQIGFRKSWKTWRLLLQTGINAFNSQYHGANGEITELRRSSEFFDPGTQVEIRLEKQFKENWFFGFGVGHHTYRRRLDVEATANIQRLYTNVLISYNEDPTTGEISNEVFADTSLRVTQLRKIKHFNRYQSWEIPVYLGYQKYVKRWNYAATFGLTASVSREMDGRVFDQDGEVGILGQEAFLPYDTEVSAAYQIEARLGYRLLPALDVHASLGRQNFIGNWMANSNNALTSRPGIWRLNFGTSVRF